MFRRRSGMAVAVLISFLVPSLNSQTDSLTSSDTTFKSKVKVVLVDVVVTDSHNQSVSGLDKKDFQIFEEGKPQAIASFEEHKGAPENQQNIPSLPPNYYTNYPLVKSADSVNVIVLDTLDTPLEYQLNVHRNVVSYLNEMKPGPRIAIFTLGKQMRMVQGFTTDHAVLLDALNHKNWDGGPQTSPLLDNAAISDGNPQAELDGKMLGMMASGHASGDAVQSMASFQRTRNDQQLQFRTQMTIQALQQLAQYLSGFPGRKNVMWFSWSYPLGAVPIKGPHLADFSNSNSYSEQVKKTTNLLTAAQVAIYPIGAEGLEVDSFTGAAVSQSLGTAAKFGGSLVEEQETRNSKMMTMDEIAEDTGGKAFYNNNGLKEEMDEAITNGSHYYTISYAPTDKRADGRFRPIKVKLATNEYKLAYRRGYFSDNKKSSDQKLNPDNKDLLQPFMGRGMPASTRIIYKIRVLTVDSSKTSIAGGNQKVKQPTTRYAVDFAVSPKDLGLSLSPDGTHQGRIEVSLIAYDHDGNLLNWAVRQIQMSMDPKTYSAYEQGGVQLHEEIDVPAGDVFLRTGIYDLATNKAGTLEIPLQTAVPAVTASK